MPDYSEQLAEKRAEDRIKKIKTKNKIAKPVDKIGGVEILLIGIIALINDALDYFGVDLLFFRLIDLLTAIILGLWCLMRLHKFPSARFSISFLIELIPFLGDFSPTWTIFILSIYLEQKGYSSEKLAKLAGNK